jgi:hypothetical protein
LIGDALDAESYAAALTKDDTLVHPGQDAASVSGESG